MRICGLVFLLSALLALLVPGVAASSGPRISPADAASERGDAETVIGYVGEQAKLSTEALTTACHKIEGGPALGKLGFALEMSDLGHRADDNEELATKFHDWVSAIDPASYTRKKEVSEAKFILEVGAAELRAAASSIGYQFKEFAYFDCSPKWAETADDNAKDAKRHIREGISILDKALAA